MPPFTPRGDGTQIKRRLDFRDAERERILKARADAERERAEVEKERVQITRARKELDTQRKDIEAKAHFKNGLGVGRGAATAKVSVGKVPGIQNHRPRAIPRQRQRRWRCGGKAGPCLGPASSVFRRLALGRLRS